MGLFAAACRIVSAGFHGGSSARLSMADLAFMMSQSTALLGRSKPSLSWFLNIVELNRRWSWEPHAPVTWSFGCTDFAVSVFFSCWSDNVTSFNLHDLAAATVFCRRWKHWLVSHSERRRRMYWMVVVGFFISHCWAYLRNWGVGMMRKKRVFGHRKICHLIAVAAFLLLFRFSKLRYNHFLWTVCILVYFMHFRL